MGEKAFRFIQWGKESSAGTPVAADTIIMGEAQPIQPDRAPTHIEDDVNLRAMSNRIRIDSRLVSDTLRVPNAYFQVLPLIFSMGVKGGVSSSEQNSSQGDWLWDFTPSMTASNTPDTGTIELGDNIQAFEAEYMMIERIAISSAIAQGADASPISVEADYFARQWTAVTKTGALSIPTNTAMNGKLSRIWRDTSWAGVGGTELTSLLRGWDLQILTGNHPKFLGSSSEFFTTTGEGKFEVTLAVDLEGTAAADTIWDLQQAGTFSVVRITVDGPQIGSGDVNNFTIDIGGFWEAVIPLGSEDRGNNIHTAMLRASYDTTGSLLFQLTTTNTVEAI